MDAARRRDIAGALLTVAAWAAGVAVAGVREVRETDRQEIPADHGLLVIAIDADEPLQGVGFRRNGSVFDAETVRPVPKGGTIRLYEVPVGTYRWEHVRADGIRYTVSDRDEYTFSVRAGAINYPGHMVVRQREKGGLLAHVANRGMLSIDWLAQKHPRIASELDFEYRGRYPDPFPAFHREHAGAAGGGNALRTVAPPPPPPDMPIPVEELWKPTGLMALDLNPAGDLVAMVEHARRPDGDRWILRMIDLQAQTSNPVLESPVEISRIDWASDRALVVSCTETGALDALFVVHVRGDGEQRRYERMRFPYKGMLVDVLASDPDHVLFASLYVGHAAAGVQLHKVPISSQRALDRYRFERRDALDRSIAEGRQWFIDGNGELRAAIAFRDEKLFLLHGRSGAFKEVMALDEVESFSPVAVSSTGDVIYGLSEKDREQRDLVELDPQTGTITRTLFSRPRVDVRTALFDQRHQLVGATYYEDGLIISEYFDEPGRDMQARLQRAFPGKTVRILDRDASSRNFLLLVGGSDRPSDVYHLDTRDNVAALLVETLPWLSGRTFRTSTVVRARSADGLDIEAYLTLPGLADGVRPPLIVFPHGGPIGVRDTRYFDREVQFLASLGYAVLQVNFRGSEGYGRGFREAGKRSFGTRIEDDIDAALTAVLEGNVVDRNRMCAMGSSYGGYSALVSAIRWPDRFRCVISIAGVSDTALLFTASDTARSSEGREALEEAIGHPVRDAGEMREYSPLYRFRDLAVPVLLAHGTEDLRVDFEHARRLSSMLAADGRPPVLLTLEGEGHGIEDEASNRILWEAVAGFLHRHLGAATSEPRKDGQAAGY